MGEMSLQIWVPILVPIFCLLITLAMGGIGWLLRNLYKTIEQRFCELRGATDDTRRCLNTRIDANERDLMTLRAELPLEYVRREDWIRFGATLDAKLDRLSTRIEEFKERPCQK